MQIENLKQLKQVIRLCRSEGVTNIKIDNVEMNILASPKMPKSSPVITPDELIQVPQPNIDWSNKNNELPTPEPIETSLDRIETDELTDEQMLMWSAQGHAEVL